MSEHEPRLFTREGEVNPFVAVEVTAHIGESGGKDILCEVDNETGELKLPESCLWKGLSTRDEVSRRKNALVRSFSMQVLHEANEPMVVLQRQGGTNTYGRQRLLRLGEEVAQVSLPTCLISYGDRGKEERRPGFGPLAVWTNPMNARNSNRIECVTVRKDGSLDLFCMYLVTLDDGASFKLVGQERWVGQVYKRRAGKPYVLRNQDKRIQDLYARNADVRAMLEEFVFVPGEHTEDFTARLQLLENRELRDLIRAASLREWSGSEDFWIHRTPATDLRVGQGHVRFLTYGVGRGSLGFLYPRDPVNFGGKQYREVRFDHRSLIGADEFMDSQGICFLPPGMVVEASDFYPEGDGPPVASRVIPLEVPVGIKSNAAKTAA